MLTIHDEISQLLALFDSAPRRDATEARKILEAHEMVFARARTAAYGSRPQKEGGNWDERRLAETLPRILESYRKGLPLLLDVLGDATNRFRSRFASEPSAEVYLWSSSTSTDACSFFFEGRQALAFNFEYVAHCSRSMLEILIAHELAHTAEKRSPRERESVGILLQSEGMATFASSILFPHFPPWKYLSYWNDDKKTFMEWQRCEAEMAAFAFRTFDSCDREHKARLFSGDPQDSAPWPPRGGYYLGWRIALHCAQEEKRARTPRLPFLECDACARAWLEKRAARDQ